MLRVAKKGIIVFEPQDPITKMPFLLFLSNLLENLKPGLINIFWQNRFSHEVVGNFVYKVSEREFEKLAAGLNLPMLAIKKVNPNFWFTGSEKVPAVLSNKKFRKILFKKKFRDILSKMGLIPSQALSVIVFNSTVEADSLDEELRNDLKENGYKLIEIPKKPYL